MIEVSELKNLDIYTIAGEYVGKVSDAILNMRLGTIAKLQVRAIEPEKKRNVGFGDILKKGLQFVPDDDEIRTYQEGLLNVDYDKVRAIGDIILIDPRDLTVPKEETAPVSEPVPQTIGI